MMTQAQLEIMQIMARPMQEEDLKAIKKLIVRYFAEKLTEAADEAWAKNEWTDDDAQRLIRTHMRTPYSQPSSSTLLS